MAGALGLFWDICHYWSEGRVLLDTALERAPAEPTIARAKALRWAGRLAASQNDYTVAHVRLEKSLTISRQLGDKKGIAWSLCYLANIAMHAGDWINCHELLDESLPLFREPPQDELGIAHCLRIEAWMSQSKGEYDSGPSLLQESVEIYRKLGFKTGLAWSIKERVDSLVHFTPGITADNYDVARSVLMECWKFADELADRLLTCEVLGTLGDLERFNGNYEAAAELYRQSKSVADELDSKISIAFAYLGLGHIMLYQGNYREAHEVFKKSITLFHAFGEKFGVVSCLFGFGAEEAKRASGSLARAVQLFSAAERQRQDMNVLSPVERREYDLILSQVQAKLSTEEFEAAWTKGKSMKLDEAVEYALGK
jgi:tetratricopeptide (TPR) repeat protein